jgi:hypothetical protein
MADARQILQGNLPLGRLGCDNELLADPVVDRSHVALFSARQPLQKPLGFGATVWAQGAQRPFFRAFALERAPDFRVVGTEPVDLRGFVEVGIGIDRHTASAEIDTQRASWCVGHRGGALSWTCKKNVPSCRLTSVALVGALSLSRAFW